MSSILFNSLGVLYRRKIPDLLLEDLRPDALPDLGKDFLYFHSCSQTVSPASVFITTANSGAHPSGKGRCPAATLSHSNFKKQIFCRRDDIKLLRDLHFIRNQPLKSADN